MKKAIKYRKFDEQGNFKGEIISSKKYTVREAMARLDRMGFVPMFDNGRKFQYVWTNEAGTNAYIM